MDKPVSNGGAYRWSRFIVAALFVAVMAGTWDAWWHGAIGRETFWEPPHLLLYSAVIAAIVGGIYGWYRTREKVWRRLAIVLTIVPLSAPFDDLWHRIFGVENISSPLIVWSPPHVALIAAIAGSFILLLPIIKRDENIVAQRLFGGFAFAGILGLLLFLAAPLQPTGPYELLGFWGAGVTAALFAGVFIVSAKWMPGLAGATLVAAFFVVLSAIGFGEQIAPDIVIQPHDHPPNWLTVFAVLAPALFIDLVKRPPIWLRGAVAGILWGGVLYGFSSMFFESQFQYTTNEALIAIFASVLGGIIAGIFISLINKPKLTHSE